MKNAKKLKSKAAPAFEENYRSALRKYSVRGGEKPLGRAYELGRIAMDGGKSLIEIAALHHQALLELFNETKEEGRRANLLRVSPDFLKESLSPYELAHRGYQEAVKALHQLNETLEEEIKRIAYAVHDEAGQLLVAVHLALADVSLELPDPQRERLGGIKKLLDQVENQLRRYSHELRPTVLDDLGWLPAIRFLAEGVSKRANLPIQIKSKVAGRLPGPVEIALYRIVQEALTNVTKHARASEVRIHAQRKGRVLCCSIEDNGEGFDVRALKAARQHVGLGLTGMRERVNAIGGTLSITSVVGSGTKLIINVPVPKDSSNADSHSSR